MACFWIDKQIHRIREEYFAPSTTIIWTRRGNMREFRTSKYLTWPIWRGVEVYIGIARIFLVFKRHAILLHVLEQ